MKNILFVFVTIVLGSHFAQAAGLRVVSLTCQGDGIAVAAAGNKAQVEIQGRGTVYEMNEPVQKHQVGVGPLSTKIVFHVPGSKSPVYDLVIAVEPSSGVTGVFESALWLSRTSTLDAPGFPRASGVQAGRPVGLLRCLITMI